MKRLLSVFILSVIFNSCHKDPSPPILIDSNIQFGNHSNMDTITYNFGLNKSYYPGQFIELDLNKDGRTDLKFEYYYDGANGGGYYSRSNVRCLHDDIYISGYLDNISTYYLIDTTYNFSFNNPSQTEQHIVETYSCSKIDVNDRLENFISDAFLINKYLDEYFLDKTSVFSSTSVSLIQFDFKPFVDYMYNAGEDTMIYKSERIIRYCNYFPSSEVGYIGFMIKDDQDVKRYGWVKLGVGVLDFDLYIYETAILKQ